MEKIIKEFLKLELDLTYFFNVSVGDSGLIRIVGDYSLDAGKHLLSKGFLEANDLYEDKQKAVEFKKDNIIIVLFLY